MSDIKEDVENLVKATKKVAKTTSEIGVEQGKKVVEKTKENATKLKNTIQDMFTEAEVETYIQFNGMEINAAEITKKAKEAHKKDGFTDEIESINLYIKPEENTVYYVINGKYAGQIPIQEE